MPPIANRSDGSSTARYRAWMSRRRLTLRDRESAHGRYRSGSPQWCLARDRCREPWAGRVCGFRARGVATRLTKLRW